MSLPLILANGDVSYEVAVHLSLDDLCRMRVSSHRAADTYGRPRSVWLVRKPRNEMSYATSFRS